MSKLANKFMLHCFPVPVTRIQWELVADPREEDVARLEWVCVNEMVPTLAHCSPVPRSHRVTSARATERQCCTSSLISSKTSSSTGVLWLLPHSCFHPAVAAQGSSVGKGSPMPCGPLNPFLESCCLVFFTGFGIHQLRMDFGWKKTQRLATVCSYCAVLEAPF